MSNELGLRPLMERAQSRRETLGSKSMDRLLLANRDRRSA